MKKRILAVFTVLALGLGILVSALSVGAAATPDFMAVNDTLLPLEDRYIPINTDGQYYIPYPVLDASVTGIDLGIHLTYNAAIRTLIIYNREKLVVFDLAKGACTDRSGNTLLARAVTRNGQIYVPARFICQYFNLAYSFFPETKYGAMIRISNASAYLSDINFVGAAQMLMEDRLNDWRKNQTAVTPPTPTTTPAPTPTPTPTPVVSVSTSSTPTTPTPPPTPTASEVDKSEVRTYLAFRADRVEGLNSLLSHLEQHQIRALFFFPADELARYDDAVRRVLCGGHGVGLLASGTTAQEIADSAAEGNRILKQVAYLHTYTILPPDGTDVAVLSALREGGLLPWNTDVDALPNGQSVSERANEVLEKTETYTEKVYILSDCSTSGSALMARLLSELVEDQYGLRLAVETEL